MLKKLAALVTVKTIATPLAIVLSAGVIWHTSNAAFVAQTDNQANVWNAASIALTDDDTGTAMFVAANTSSLKPGSTGSRCIVVTYNGSTGVTAPVKFYSANVSSTNSFGDYINLTVDEGTGGTYAASSSGSCSGFTTGTNIYTGTLTALGSGKTNYSNGVGTWAPSGASQTKVYKITYTVDAAAPSTTQGGTAGAKFVWEAQA